MSASDSFAALGLSAPLLQVLEELGYETPTPIQAACIPALLGGRDVIGQAQTGTGKTAAFALPVLHRLDPTAEKPQALVLTPTRELAIQVAEAFQSYARKVPGFHVLPIYGGQSMSMQLRALRRTVHVIVGTPGRVVDHLERGTLALDQVRTLVLDEADEMLRMGFIEAVEWILEHTPATRQTALFSATMPEPIRRVARKHLSNAEEVKIANKTATVAKVRQRFWQVDGLHKLDALTRILEVEATEAVLIFVRTRMSTVELAEKLEARGYGASALNGDMNQAQRERTVEDLKSGKLDIVIATDVAARGLDVPRISHVINYDVPYDSEAYIHRIGRTGRAGRAGEAILFVSRREMHMLRGIERATRAPITPMQPPSKEAIASRRVNVFKEQLADVLASEDLDFFRRLVSDIEQEQQAAPEDMAAALAFLLQRERPLQAPHQERPASANTRRTQAWIAAATDRSADADRRAPAPRAPASHAAASPAAAPRAAAPVAAPPRAAVRVAEASSDREAEEVARRRAEKSEKKQAKRAAWEASQAAAQAAAARSVDDSAEAPAPGLSADEAADQPSASPVPAEPTVQAVESSPVADTNVSAASERPNVTDEVEQSSGDAMDGDVRDEDAAPSGSESELLRLDDALVETFGKRRAEVSPKAQQTDTTSTDHAAALDASPESMNDDSATDVATAALSEEDSVAAPATAMAADIAATLPPAEPPVQVGAPTSSASAQSDEAIFDDQDLSDAGNEGSIADDERPHDAAAGAADASDADASDTDASDTDAGDAESRDTELRDEQPPHFQQDPSVRAAPLKEFPGMDMVRYRIDVGHVHGVQVKNIVGAIANEAEIDNRYIGRIDINEDFSTVDLPAGMPPELVQHMKGVRLGPHTFNMRELTSAESRPPRVRRDDGSREGQRAALRRGDHGRGAAPRGEWQGDAAGRDDRARPPRFDRDNRARAPRDGGSRDGGSRGGEPKRWERGTRDSRGNEAGYGPVRRSSAADGAARDEDHRGSWSRDSDSRGGRSPGRDDHPRSRDDFSSARDERPRDRGYGGGAPRDSRGGDRDGGRDGSRSFAERGERPRFAQAGGARDRESFEQSRPRDEHRGPPFRDRQDRGARGESGGYAGRGPPRRDGQGGYARRDSTDRGARAGGKGPRPGASRRDDSGPRFNKKKFKGK